MPKKGSKPGPRVYSRYPNAWDSSFVSHNTHAGEGPSPLLLTQPARRATIIQEQMARAESVLAVIDTQGITERLNQKFLHGAGNSVFYYSAISRNGDTTSTGDRLKFSDTGTPRNVPFYDPIALELKDPSVMIGLFGDARRMRRGENHMTHLAVVDANSSSQDDIDAALRKSRRWGYKLTKINPSLDITQFSPRKWERLKRKAERRATKLLKRQLNNSKEVRLAEQHVRDTIVGTGGIILGALVAKGVAEAFPIVQDNVESIIHHFIK